MLATIERPFAETLVPGAMYALFSCLMTATLIATPAEEVAAVEASGESLAVPVVTASLVEFWRTSAKVPELSVSLPA